MKKKDIPVLLLTGYLGSGKTTLVNHILRNERGIRFAVIVNDLGEVNIDADLIQRGGVVGKKDESLVALQNGCICCTLRADLIEQVEDILRMQRFDYIVIEASGICEPEPIAQTLCSIPSLGEAYTQHGTARLDCVATVVDALRLQSEFACGEDLTCDNIDEEDIESLIIQQIEFCDLILLNKASEVSPDELARIRRIIRVLQPSARIIECDYARVDLDKLLNTGLFDYERVALSAGWIKEIEAPAEQEGHHDHHDHHDNEEEGEAEEYGIGTFVYYRRRPFDIHRFDRFVSTQWPASVIRAKGVCYFAHNRDMSFLFEQAGRQKQLSQAGLWYATSSPEDLAELMRREPGLARDWDDTYGDRMQKLVFIGQRMDTEQIARSLDACLAEE